MSPPAHLAALDSDLAATPGTVSVWCAPIGASTPPYARLENATHYAASTMKVAVLAALHRAHESGELDLDAPVPVRNVFTSALAGAAEFHMDTGYDNDEAVWARLGGSASLRWLAERMIVRSSNFATNTVLAHVGLPAVAEVWRSVGARHSVTARGIEDYAARDAGIDNLITAADLAALLGAIALGAQEPTGTQRATGTQEATGGHPLAGTAACRQMLATLCAQERREDLAAGLPDGTRIAHKNGWVTGVRHGAGVVFPADADPYTIVVATTTPLADGQSVDDAGVDGRDRACHLIATVAAASWADRHTLSRAA
jgi:beta-lactamase class A